MRQRRDVRFRQRDWLGPAYLTIFFGAVVVAAEFLPWANSSGNGDLDFSLTKPDWISSGFTGSGYSRPALIVGLVVMICGLLMVLLGPVRVSLWPGLIVFISGFVAVALAHGAGMTMYGSVRPGLGLFLLTLSGVLLVPVGFAGAIVGYIIKHEGEPGAD